MRLRNKFEYRDAGSVMLWALLAMQAAGLVFGLVAVGLKKPELTENILIAGAVTNAALLAVYFLHTHMRGIPLRESGIANKFSWWVIPVGIAVTVALQYCTVPVLTLVEDGLSALGYESVNTAVNTDFGAYGAVGYVFYALVTCLLTGFTEEMLFRGAILSGFRARFGTVGAVVMSGVAFSLFHCSPDQTLFQFAFGCILALLTVRSGSVVPAMVCHAVNNGLSILYSEIGFSYPMPTQIGVLIAVAVAGAILAATVLPLVVNAACGEAKKTWWIALILRKKQAVSQTLAQTETPAYSAENARFSAHNNKKQSSGWLVLACVICVVLWVSQLVMGFTSN